MGVQRLVLRLEGRRLGASRQQRECKKRQERLSETLHIERGREGRSSLSPAITFSPNVALNTIEKLPPRLILWTSGQRKNAYAAFVVSSRQQRVGRVGVA